MKNKKQIADFSLRVVRHFAGSNNAGSYEHAADFRWDKNNSKWRRVAAKDEETEISKWTSIH